MAKELTPDPDSDPAPDHSADIRFPPEFVPAAHRVRQLAGQLSDQSLVRLELTKKIIDDLLDSSDGSPEIEFSFENLDKIQPNSQTEKTISSIWGLPSTVPVTLWNQAIKQSTESELIDLGPSCSKSSGPFRPIGPLPTPAKVRSSFKFSDPIVSSPWETEVLDIKSERIPEPIGGTRPKVAVSYPMEGVTTTEDIKNKDNQAEGQVKIKKSLLNVFRTRLPQMVVRMTALLSLVAQPNFSITVVDTPIELSNLWGVELTEIKRQLNQGYGTVKDQELFSEYSGFYHLETLTQLTKYLTSNSYLAYHLVSELFKFVPQIAHLENYCTACDIIHSHPPLHCNPTKKHGPRIMKYLKLNDSWRTDIQAVCLGCNDLLYLPVDLMGMVLNLGDPQSYYYNIPNTPEEYCHVSTSSSSLFARIVQVIELIGANKTYPIFIEFSVAPDLSQPIIFHIIGFLSTIRKAQQKYYGPLIVMVTQVSPMPGMNGGTYLDKKRAFHPVQRMLYAAGQALGVPVCLPPTHSIEAPGSSARIRCDFWEDEALYSYAGVKTREYYSRMSYYIRAIIKAYAKRDDGVRHVVAP